MTNQLPHSIKIIITNTSLDNYYPPYLNTLVSLGNLSITKPLPESLQSLYINEGAMSINFFPKNLKTLVIGNGFYIKSNVIFPSNIRYLILRNISYGYSCGIEITPELLAYFTGDEINKHLKVAAISKFNIIGDIMRATDATIYRFFNLREAVTLNFGYKNRVRAHKFPKSVIKMVKKYIA